MSATLIGRYAALRSLPLRTFIFKSDFGLKPLFIRSFYNGRSGRNDGDARPARRNRDFVGFSNRDGRNLRDKRGRDTRRTQIANDEDLLSNSKLTKVIRVPENLDDKEITIDQLKDDGIINKDLHKAIARMNFPGLTPVQQKTIKPILETENDVIARAKTGTGKTLAFLVPMFEHLISTRTESPYMVKCVIVAPTRDLALQIQSEIEKIHKNNYGLKKFKSIALIGGSNFGTAMRTMRRDRPNIVVATPGRLIDVLSKYSDEYFKYVDFKILDEADRLLEIGFDEDLRQISNTLNSINAKGPDSIRTLLFSATLGDNVQELANGIMNRDECLFLDTVDKNEPEAHEKIEQKLVISETFAESMYAPVAHIKTRLEEDNKFKAILFVPTVKFTKFYCEMLESVLPSLPIYEFHGKVDQRKRTKMVQHFKKAKEGLFVCTDVGARGMDFPDVEEVLQLGPPSEISNYVHRIGRTARGGKEGKASIYLCKAELPFIDTLSNEKNITIKEQCDFEPVDKDIIAFTEAVPDQMELSDALLSLLSFYKGCEQAYRFRFNNVARQIAGSYGYLLGDPLAKMRISRDTASMRFGLRGRSAQDLFDLGPQNSYNNSYQNTRSRNSGSRGSQFENKYGGKSAERKWHKDTAYNTKRANSYHRGSNPKIE
ncbi:LAFE_0H06128g1_1 [Lachancea fermentati]|uniref:ATP-dependent RNA helicase n=1 Tax=Lachancea fermentati TaxID=4955 RepID=A0A1G4MK49_LACFM|nr:LAFE_0H06128g1_1 [Lachancea fermentati]